jgi:hypothetical protein
MPIAELLNNARFLTNQQGEKTDVLLSIETGSFLPFAIGKPPVNGASPLPMSQHAIVEFGSQP